MVSSFGVQAGYHQPQSGIGGAFDVGSANKQTLVMWEPGAIHARVPQPEWTGPKEVLVWQNIDNIQQADKFYLLVKDIDEQHKEDTPQFEVTLSEYAIAKELPRRLSDQERIPAASLLPMVKWISQRRTLTQRQIIQSTSERGHLWFDPYRFMASINRGQPEMPAIPDYLAPQVVQMGQSGIVNPTAIAQLILNQKHKAQSALVRGNLYVSSYRRRRSFVPEGNMTDPTVLYNQWQAAQHVAKAAPPTTPPPQPQPAAPSVATTNMPPNPLANQS